MRYSDDLVEEVRARSDIVDVVSGYIGLKRKGSSWFGLCPFHNEKSASFSVSRDKQMYYCFGCGAGGDVFNFVMDYENFSFTEAVQTLAQRSGMELPQQEDTPQAARERDLKTQLLEIHKEAAKFYYLQLRGKNGEQAYQYLKGRALSDETIRSFGLGFAPKTSNGLYLHLKQMGYADLLLNQSGLFLFDEKSGIRDKFWNRVMFPIMDIHQHVIGFGGRVMGDGKPKYLNSPETTLFNKSKNLYGLNYARKARKKNLIACEGYMDVIAMHQAGFTNAVASLGTALTTQQVSLMKRYTDEVLLLYDSDAAGRNAALRAIPLLTSVGIRTKVISLHPFKDPDEFIKNQGVKAFEERLLQGTNGFMFRIEMEEEKYDLKDPQGRTDFLHKAVEMVFSIEDEIERNSYLHAIANRYHTDVSMLERMLRQLAMRGAPVQSVVPDHEIPVKRRGDKEDGYAKAQKLLLTWIVSYPDIYRSIRSYVSVEDFTVPLYRKIAGLLDEQLKQGTLNPARIMSEFSEGDEHNEAASVFHARLQLSSDKERQQALFDVICRIKESSLEQRMKDLSDDDMRGLMTVIEERKQLEDLKNGKRKFEVSFVEG